MLRPFKSDSVYRSLLLEAFGEILIVKFSSLGLGGLGGSNGLLVSGTLLGGVFLKELLVRLGGIARSLDSVDLVSLEGHLSADSLLSNHSLDMGGLPVGLVRFLSDLSVDDVFAGVIELFVKSESGTDSVGSLSSESVGSVGIVASSDVLVSLLDDSEGDDGKIGSGNASTDGLSLTLTSSTGSVGSSLLSEEDARSSVDEDTLLHGESLLVISSSDSEDVALVVVTEVLSVNFVTHSLVEEGTDEFLLINFNFLVSSGKGV